MQRTRYLQLQDNSKSPYAIPNDPSYQDVVNFIASYKVQGYPFNVLTLLHAAGEKMLAYPGKKISRKQSLFASGGLYLALDAQHPDLALRRHFGDFTSGFSHQFGVALSAMTMSEAFGISWDRLNQIPVKRKRTLDYKAKIPGTNNILYVEAKGVTSEDSRSKARRSVYGKKQETKQGLSLNQVSPQGSAVMVGVITQAVHGGTLRIPYQAQTVRSSQGLIEVIDPELPSEDIGLSEADELAGMYWHYTGAALFAGVYAAAKEFVLRATGLMNGKGAFKRWKDFPISEDVILPLVGRNFIGVQWRPGEGINAENDVWFYQAMDVAVLERILVTGLFPPIPHYIYHEPLTVQKSMMNLLPDGSLFGIGTERLAGLIAIDQRETDIANLQF